MSEEKRIETFAILAADADAPNLAREALALASRIRDGLFYVACIGQNKRGKSTLINALVGNAFLPADVIPATSVVTIVRYGEKAGARVQFITGGWNDIDPEELNKYVTEEFNPGNSKAVSIVEVCMPSSLLAAGMCLVDTPGIGSIFKGNTETTHAFVPHVDAALVVLGTDPPISADELSLIKQIAKQCKSLIFVLSKADKFTDQERKRAFMFTRNVLDDQLDLKSCPLFELSAMTCLRGDASNHQWPLLIGELQKLAEESGSGFIQTASDRVLSFLAGRLHRYLNEQKQSLLRPVEESEQRVKELHEFVRKTDQSLMDLGYLFTSERERLARIFCNKKEEFLKIAQPAAKRELIEAIRATKPLKGPVIRDQAITFAQEISKRWLDQWLEEAQPVAETFYIDAARRFVDLANSFLSELTSACDPAFGCLPESLDQEKSFRAGSRLYYTNLMPLASQTLFGWFLDMIRSRDWQLRVLERDIGSYLETLILANATRITNDFDYRVLESHRQFQAEIRSALSEIVSLAEHSLNRAKSILTQGSMAVENEINRINALSLRLDELDIVRKEKYESDRDHPLCDTSCETRPDYINKAGAR